MIFLSNSQKKLTSLTLMLLLLALSFAPSAWAVRQAKFGPYATPITEKTDFLRSKAQSDYWKFSQFYLPQQTSSACGLASTVMALNFLIGVPRFWDETLITQPALLQSVFTGEWEQRVAEGGDGLHFAELVNLVNNSLRYYRLQRNYTVEVIDPAHNPITIDELKQKLRANEDSLDDLMLVYFNQGVLTSDWDGPHISPIGAYDYNTLQVLMMDVDREWYPPYWSSVDKLMEAMLRPAPADQGILAGETGGIVWIRKNR